MVQNSDIKTDFKTLRTTFDTPDRKYNCKLYDSIGGIVTVKRRQKKFMATQKGK